MNDLTLTMNDLTLTGDEQKFEVPLPNEPVALTHSHPLCCVTLSPSCAKLAFSTIWGPAGVHDVKYNKTVSFADCLWPVKWDPTGTLLAGGTADGNLYLYKDGQRQNLASVDNFAHSIAWVSDNDLVASSVNCARLYDVTTQKQKFEIPYGGVVAGNPLLNTLLISGTHGESSVSHLYMYDMRTGGRILEVSRVGGTPATVLALGKTNGLIATATVNIIEALDVRNGIARTHVCPRAVRNMDWGGAHDSILSYTTMSRTVCHWRPSDNCTVSKDLLVHCWSLSWASNGRGMALGLTNGKAIFQSIDEIEQQFI